MLCFVPLLMVFTAALDEADIPPIGIVSFVPECAAITVYLRSQSRGTDLVSVLVPRLSIPEANLVHKSTSCVVGCPQKLGNHVRVKANQVRSGVQMRAAKFRILSIARRYFEWSEVKLNTGENHTVR